MNNSTKKLLFAMLALLVMLYPVYSATVSHPASQVTAGSFQAGNYTFQNSAFVTDNFGIGTVNPTQKLHVTGSVNISGSSKLYVPEICLGGTCRSSWMSSSSAGGWINTSTQTYTTLNVGIGTISPSAFLDINKTGMALRVKSEAGANIFYINSTAGYIGIGTAVPTKHLEVSDGTDSIIIDPAATIPTINTTNSQNLTISSDGGNVIIRLGS